MLDTMIYDRLLADQATLDRLVALATLGAITFMTTHIQADQLAATEDINKREALLDTLLKIPAERIPTEAGAFDVSRWGEFKWGDATTNAKTDELSANNLQHLEDALIGVTAAANADVFVTADRKFSSRLKRGVKLQVWKYEDLVAHVMTLRP